MHRPWKHFLSTATSGPSKTVRITPNKATGVLPGAANAGASGLLVTKPSPNTLILLESLRNGDRAALAKAITLGTF
jgi:hypothetical protein